MKKNICKQIAVVIINVFIILMGSSEMCAALEEKGVEDYLAVFKPKEITGERFEEIKALNRLDETKKIAGGLYRFDISYDGTIAVIYDEDDPTLVVYDKDINELYRLDVMSVEGVMLCGKKIVLFWKDCICGVFDTEGLLIAAYELTDLEDLNVSSESYNALSKICCNNERKVDADRYYLTNAIHKKPRSIEQHAEYGLLVKESEDGKKTVLLRHMETICFNFLRLPIFIVIMIASFFVLNLKYHFLDRKKVKYKKG